jgi:hypothetical protein
MHVWPPILAVLIIFIALLYNRQLGWGTQDFIHIPPLNYRYKKIFICIKYKYEK